MTEDKIKENEHEKEYTINCCGWNSEKMQLRRQKIKQIYKAANPGAYVNANDEKTLDEFVKAYQWES